MSLQAWTISPGLYGDLFRIRGFAPITGLISFFSRPLSSSPLCSTTDSLLTSQNLLLYSLSSVFFFFSSNTLSVLPTFHHSSLPCNTSHISCFKSSDSLYTHTPRRLRDRFVVTLEGRHVSSETILKKDILTFWFLSTLAAKCVTESKKVMGTSPPACSAALFDPEPPGT